MGYRGFGGNRRLPIFTLIQNPAKRKHDKGSVGLILFCVITLSSCPFDTSADDPPACLLLKLNPGADFLCHVTLPGPGAALARGKSAALLLLRKIK